MTSLVLFVLGCSFFPCVSKENDMKIKMTQKARQRALDDEAQYQQPKKQS